MISACNIMQQCIFSSVFECACFSDHIHFSGLGKLVCRRRKSVFNQWPTKRALQGSYFVR